MCHGKGTNNIFFLCLSMAVTSASSAELIAVSSILYVLIRKSPFTYKVPETELSSTALTSKLNYFSCFRAVRVHNND